MIKQEETKYLFKDERGELHAVDFATMMEAESGFLRRPNGELWQRVVAFEEKKSSKQAEHIKFVSDSMGFPEHQLQEMQDHLEATGVQGIEFKKEDDFTGFYQVHASSRKAMRNYMNARGWEDFGKTARAVMSPKILRDSAELIARSCNSKN